MERMIAFCGIDCATCPTRVATMANDDLLRARTAADWSARFGFPFTKEMIHCTGCHADGKKFSHCQECEIRACGSAKGVRDCGACADFTSCAKIAAFLAQGPELRENLVPSKG